MIFGKLRTLMVRGKDGELHDIVAIKGAKGDKGDKGDPGPQGPKGDPTDISHLATKDELKVVDDKIKDLELFKFPNATIIGEPTIANGQVSDFTTNDYLRFPFIADVHNRPFEIGMCFTTGSDVNTQQNIMDSEFGLALAIQNGRGIMAISSNGTSWDIGLVTGTRVVEPNMTYYAKVSWDGTTYKTSISVDGTSFVDDMTKTSTVGPYPRTIFIGGSYGLFGEGTDHPFKGTINLNHAYLKVEDLTVWTGMDDAGLSTRADVSLANIDDEGVQKIRDVAETDTKKMLRDYDVSPYEKSVLIWKKHANTDYTAIAEGYKLRDGNEFDFVTFTLKSPNAVNKYYSTLENAALDLNDGTYARALPNSTNAKIQLVVNDSLTGTSYADPIRINVIRLLSNITTSTAIDINKSVVLDLNGFILKPTSSITFGEFNSDVIIYGNKPGSGIINDEWNNNTRSTRVIVLGCKNSLVLGGTYRIINNNSTAMYQAIFSISGDSKLITHVNFEMHNCAITFVNNNSAITPNAQYSNSCVSTYYSFAPYYLKIKNCNIREETNIGVGHALYTTHSWNDGMAIVENCTITAIGPDLGDNTIYGIQMQNSHALLVKNSHVFGTNAGIGCRCKHVSIANSILEGGGHGGAYFSGEGPVWLMSDDRKSYEITSSNAFVSNTIFRKTDGTPTPNCNNPYAMYIGYNAHVYFDNCVFDSYNGLYNIPAIKTGDYDNHKFHNTISFFSNCSMNGIRCDTYCRAYVGSGMPQSIKSASVSGTLIVTDDTYSHIFSILELTDIPNASAVNAGMAKVNGVYGLAALDDGTIYPLRATADYIDNRSDWYRPITPSMLDYAVEAAMTDKKGPEWSDSKKESGRNRLGIVTLTQEEYNLIGTPSESTIYLIVG